MKRKHFYSIEPAVQGGELGREAEAAKIDDGLFENNRKLREWTKKF